MSHFGSGIISQFTEPPPQPKSEHSIKAKCTAEFLGTFLLVFTIGCNIIVGSPVWAGVSIAAVLMVSIYALGGISGGNFNPGVTLALFLTNTFGCAGSDMSLPTLAKYWASQLAGGVAGGCASAMLTKGKIPMGPSSGGGESFDWMQAGACEFLYTAVLCFVVLNVAASKRRPDSVNEFYGLAIGFVIIAGAYGAGAVSGGAFNPSVAIGRNVSADPVRLWYWCVIYSLFELAGAAFAAGLFRFVRSEEANETQRPGAHDLPQRLTSEFLGTFVLVLTVGLNVLAGSQAAAFSIAASLTCMIYALGDVSGAHFNPAVTLAALASGRCPDLQAGTAAAYVVAQLAGGLCAQLAFYGIYPAKSITLGPQSGFGWSDVILAETVFTFVLCLAVLCSAVHPKSKNGTMFGFIIGSCVTVGGLAIGGVSGGSLNPAVSLALDARHLSSGAQSAIIYSVCEFLGAGLAAGVMMFTHGTEKGLP